MPRPEPPPPTTPAKLRIAFYSHDTVGLGHIRRNIALAAAVVAALGDVDVLLLTGNPEATSLPLPPQTDVVTLPTLAKGADGRYRSRTLSGPVERVLEVRSALLEAALTSFDPDLLVVDKVPRGVRDELVPALRRLRATGRTRTVLGLREVLDEPTTAVAEWRRSRATEAVDELYDAVWVYGDRAVYDPVVEYRLPASVAAKVTYTGYLGRDRFDGTSTRGDGTATAGGDPATVPAGPYVLCTVGGGQDGAALAAAFAAAPMPPGHTGVVVCGPFMAPLAREAVHRAAAADAGVTVLDFVPHADALVAGAAAVVSMAGYNSVCEVLATDAPALLVPRCRPRAEQRLRAERLSALGLAEVLAETDVSPTALGRWLATTVRASGQPAARAAATVDLDGLRRVPALVTDLLTPSRKASSRAA
ncbi:glycosyltransferase [Microlunatus lacustris]